MKLRYLCFPLILAACGQQPEGDPVTRINLEDGTAQVAEADPVPIATPSAAPIASACESIEFQDVPLTHCIADPAEHRITTALGPPYRSMARLAEARGSDVPVFAVNGGMYDGDGKPIGYYVEKGDRQKLLNRNDGPGNFHLKPNGVFYGSGSTWRIKTSDDFYASVADRPQFGTQSGPMLLIDGKLHPEFSEDGPSRQIRNGVGVDRQGRAHFVISEAPISFGKFARFFRDVADTPNALFLDGNVSALWDPASDRIDSGAALGPLIVVESKE